MVESQGRRKDTWVKAVRHYMAAKAALKRRTALGPGPAMPPIPPEMPPDQSPVDMPPVVDDPPGVPPLLASQDVLRYATINGAKGLRLDKKIGSLTPGKEADIIILDATAINVAPLNHVPGAVVSLMERSNVETVIVAGKIRKWKGRLLGVNIHQLRTELENSRDYIFAAAGVPKDLFRKPL